MTTAHEFLDETTLAPTTPARVLVVEDDWDIAQPLVHALESEGYAVTWVNSGANALAHLAGDRTELMTLDLGLPDMDGLDVCSRARAAGYTGAIMIASSRGAELDLVVGLDHGADDYLAKPFGLAEFQARARALVRRAGRAAEPAPSSGVTLRVDADARRVFADGVEIEMGAKEFDLLRLLSAHRDEVVARDRLTAAAWSEHWYGSRKTLDVTIARLRQKLAEAGITDRIAAVRGVGFRLESTTD